MTILGSVCGDADNPCPHSIIPGVWGRCPACGNRSLGLHGQVVQCDHRGCPDPLAAAKTLDLDHRHVLDVRDDGWSIEHPVACRLDRRLLDCTVHRMVQQDLDAREPSGVTGRFYVTPDPIAPGGFTTERLD